MLVYNEENGKYYCICSVCTGQGGKGGGIIRSGGNTKIIMVIDIVGTWCIGIPLCLLAAYVFEWGIVGVYTLLTTEEIFRLVVSLIIFKRRKWMISLS